MEKLFKIIVLLIILLSVNVSAQNNSDLVLKTYITYVNGTHENIEHRIYTDALSTCYIVNSDATTDKINSYVINPTNSIGMPESLMIGAISSSAETWNSATTKKVFNPYSIDRTYTPSVYDLYPTSDNNGVAFGELGDYTYTSLAVTNSWISTSTGKIVHFDIIMNRVDVPWTDGAVQDRFDFQSTVTHELGHSFGLGDLYNSPCSEETMYGYGFTNSVKQRTLNDGDIAGLQIIYPGIVPTPTPTPTIEYGTITGSVHR